jgi:hypothetical protein
MRKTVVLIIALIGMSSQMAFAQLSVGVKGSVNWANVYTTEVLGEVTPDFKSIDEFNFGLVGELGLTKHFAVQSELNFIRKGFEIAEGFNANLFNVEIPLGITSEARFSYIEIPLLAKVKFGEGPLQAYAIAGPTFGYATSGRLDNKANVLVPINLGSVDINLDQINYERFEVGALAGVGANLDLGSVSIFADARYNLGFTELYDIPIVEEKIKNKGFALSAGIMFNL